MGPDDSLFPALANYYRSLHNPFICLTLKVEVKSQKYASRRKRNTHRREPDAKLFKPALRSCSPLEMIDWDDRDKYWNELNATQAQCLFYGIATARTSVHENICYHQRADYDDFDLYQANEIISIFTNPSVISPAANPRGVRGDPHKDLDDFRAHVYSKCGGSEEGCRLLPAARAFLENAQSMAEIVNYLETNHLMAGVDQIEFSKFVKRVRNFQPWSTPELLFSEDVFEAENGDLDKQKFVARSYFYGLNGFPVNFKASVRYYKLAAEQSDGDSECQLAIFSTCGLGLRASFDSAKEYYQRAIAHGSLEAQWRYPLFLEWSIREGPKSIERVPYFHLMMNNLETGNREALYHLGRLVESNAAFHYGREQAIPYYQKAALQGHLEALRRLWNIYQKLGKSTDAQEIVDYVMGLGESPYIESVSRTYCSIGRDSDAYQLLTLTKSNEDPQCLSLLADLTLRGFSKTPGDRKFEAALLYRQAVTVPHAFQQLISLCHEFHQEEGVQKVRALWNQIYLSTKVSAEKFLQIHYAKFLEEMELWKPAFVEYQRIVRRTFLPAAEYKVGMTFLYAPHHECRQNTRKGLHFLKLAAEQNYADAHFARGKWYLAKQKVRKALPCLESACRFGHIEAIMLTRETLKKRGGADRDLKMEFGLLLTAASVHEDDPLVYEAGELARSAEYAGAQFSHGKKFYKLCKEQKKTGDSQICQDAKYWLIIAASHGHKQARELLQELVKATHGTKSEEKQT
jgi:TPR repeat protein